MIFASSNRIFPGGRGPRVPRRRGSTLAPAALPIRLFWKGRKSPAVAGRGALCARSALVTNPDDFEVGRFLGSYGFMNVTSYSSFQTGGLSRGGSLEELNLRYSSEDMERLKVQDVGEGQVKIRLYEGRIVQGPLRGTQIVFKVYPGQRAGGVEADMMAANELNAHAFLQGETGITCQNIQILIGGFETKTGEQWLAFRNDGIYSAADYGKVTSEDVLKFRTRGLSWNPFDWEQKIKQRRKFVIKLLNGAMNGLAYMHDNEKLHQSLGPASIILKYTNHVKFHVHLSFFSFSKVVEAKCLVLFLSFLLVTYIIIIDSTVMERDAAYLVPRLRDLAFSVDIRYSSLNTSPGSLSEGLWRRASAAGAFTLLEKRAFGIADDIYEAGLLFAYLTFIPFCEAGVMDGLSLQRLFEGTFKLDLEAAREYCLADDRLIEAVKFLDLDDRAGWQLLQAMLNPDYRQRPIAEAVLNHHFMTSAVL